MQIFWLNGGLQIQPESREERAAIGLLFDSARKTSIYEINQAERDKSLASVVHDAMHGRIDEAEVLVVDGRPVEFINEKPVLRTDQSLEHIE